MKKLKTVLVVGSLVLLGICASAYVIELYAEYKNYKNFTTILAEAINEGKITATIEKES